MKKLGPTVVLAVTALVSTVFTLRSVKGQDKRPMIPMAVPRYAYSGRLNANDSILVEDFRQAGLSGDRSQIPFMVSALKHPLHIGYTYTTIHALAQMGSIEALPVFETYTQNEARNTEDETGGDLRNFTIAAKARLIAENAAHATPAGGKATAVKVQRFYKELGLTPSSLNDALSAYYHPSQTSIDIQDAPQWISAPTDSTITHPVGVYAVRELADMMYHGGFTEGANLTEVSQVDFSSDYPSALKVRLAPLSPSERLNTMLRELSQKKFLTHWDNYEIQLASNEGLSASNAAAKLLGQMEANSKQYDEVGFTALVRVMWGTGDQTKATLVQHLLENKLIYTGNLPIADLTNGIKRGREPAY